MRKIRGWCRIILAFVLIAGWAVLTDAGARARSPSRRPLYRARRQRGGSRLFCWATGIRVTSIGKVPPTEPMLYVSNHITAIDPILVGTQATVAFVGKISIIGWPVLGWIARTHGIMGVDRRRRTSALEMVSAIRGRLAIGVPVMVFPEVGIGGGDTLRPFKASAFEAVTSQTKGRILPLFIHVEALDGRPTDGSEGRSALTYQNHTTLLGHLTHVLGYRTIGVQIRFGSPIATDSLNRRELAEQGFKAVLQLQDQKQ